MPQNEQQIESTKVKFFRIGGFPLVIGAIDGTHIRVDSFGGPNAELYRNRKTYFSINAQMIVNADVNI